jgi:calcineurin-like phosphoesterase
MTGITDSIIGMDVKICLERTRKQVLYRMEPANAPGNATGTMCAAVQGIIAEIDGETGKALSVRRI